MRALLTLPMLALLAFPAPAPVSAQETALENLITRPEPAWRFFTDRVMGGVSDGQANMLREDGAAVLRLSGTVSTANNGGFIQIRTDLPTAAASGATGVRLVVRGNDQRYFVHLRTSETGLPWQYYQAGFDVAGDWTEVRLPFTSFEASGNLLRAAPRAADLTSLGVVAYGRDHDALIDVKAAGFY